MFMSFIKGKRQKTLLWCAMKMKLGCILGCVCMRHLKEKYWYDNVELLMWLIGREFHKKFVEETANYNEGKCMTCTMEKHDEAIKRIESEASGPLTIFGHLKQGDRSKKMWLN